MRTEESGREISWAHVHKHVMLPPEGLHVNGLFLRLYLGVNAMLKDPLATTFLSRLGYQTNLYWGV